MSDTSRSVKEGIGFGLVAGVIFAATEVLAAALMGDPPIMPFRMFASVVLGLSAMETAPVVNVLVIGSTAHLALSGIYGLIYGLANSALPIETRTGWGRQLGLSLLFGVGLWLVNFQVIARILYPWFLGAPQLLQALLHAGFFGAPLGLLYAASERRAIPARLAAHAH